MTEKDIQKLKRVELLEILVEQGKEIEALKLELEEANKKLEDRKIRIENAGSIAEAVCQINGVFEAAEAAAYQYVESVRFMSENQEEICKRMEQQTKERCELMEKETKEKCEAMVEAAEKETTEKWKAFTSKVNDFRKAHKGLLEMFELVGGIQIDLDMK